MIEYSFYYDGSSWVSPEAEIILAPVAAAAGSAPLRLGGRGPDPHAEHPRAPAVLRRRVENAL